MISSYKAAQLHMEKARDKAKGRPMKGSGWRLFQEGDMYVVRVWGDEIGLFLSDNTFQFSPNGAMARRTAPTLSATMHRNLPFAWARVGGKMYRVEHRANLDGERWRWDWMRQPTNAPLVYPGLTFDLTTGKCLNPKPDAAFKPEVDPERRKVWLAALRAWKRQVKIAARLGVFDPLMAANRANPPCWYDRPNWSEEIYLDILYTAIKDGRCDTDLLRMFVDAKVTQYTPPLTSMDMFEEVERVVAVSSVALRKRFGVLVERK
jgi:hypothetical protein